MTIYRDLWNSVFQDCFSSNLWMYVWTFFFYYPKHIYNNYFKGHQRLRKCDVKSCLCKLWLETEFALIHLSYEKTAVFVHCKVLWPRSILIFIMWWTEELCRQHFSLVGDWSRILGFAQLVSHVLRAMHWKWEIVTTEQVQLCIGISVQL